MGGVGATFNWDVWGCVMMRELSYVVECDRTVPSFLLGLPPFTRARRENPNPLTRLVHFEYSRRFFPTGHFCLPQIK